MMDNASGLMMFTLSGSSVMTNYRVLLFIITFLFYCLIWLVNLTIIVTVIVDRNLHEPMYIFICNLCINGLYGTAGFYPKFLMDLVSATYVISHTGCLVQGFVLHSSVSADFSILVLMAYDRYLAICRPLRYHSVMTKQRVCVFVFIAWLVPVCLVSTGTITTSRLTICGSHIPKVYCVNYFINKIACSTTTASVIIPAFAYTFYVGHVIFILWSYVYLVRMCQTSKENRSKFMQTCLPHLFCLIVLAMSMLFDLLHMRFGSKHLSQDVQNFMAIEFILIPPITNPIIYGMKLKKIKNRIRQSLCGKIKELK